MEFLVDRPTTLHDTTIALTFGGKIKKREVCVAHKRTQLLHMEVSREDLSALATATLAYKTLHTEKGG